MPALPWRLARDCTHSRGPDSADPWTRNIWLRQREWFSRLSAGSLRRVQRKFDADGVEWEDDLVVQGLVQQPGINERVHIAVNCLHIASDVARDFPDRERSLAGHRLEQLPPFGGEHLPQQFRCGEAYPRGLLLASERLERTTRHISS